MTDQLSSLKGLETRLTDITSYLDKVIDGSLPINHQIIYNLQDILNLLPNVNLPDTSKSFSIKTNDELLVIYLCSMVRATIALHNLIENKLENSTAEKEKSIEVKKDSSKDAKKDDEEKAAAAEKKDKR